MKSFTFKVTTPLGTFHVIASVHSKRDVGDTVKVSEALNKDGFWWDIQVHRFAHAI